MLGYSCIFALKNFLCSHEILKNKRVCASVLVQLSEFFKKSVNELTLKMNGIVNSSNISLILKILISLVITVKIKYTINESTNCAEGAWIDEQCREQKDLHRRGGF